MIKDKVKDFNFVPPNNLIIDAIESLENQVTTFSRLLGETVKSIATLRGKVDKIQKDFDLIKKYTK
jgi:hypothetical protein